MTMPCERTRALLQTRELLERLQDPAETPRLPRWLRDEAIRLLRHYPSSSNLELAHWVLPDWFGPVPHFGEPTAATDVQSRIVTPEKEP